MNPKLTRSFFDNKINELGDLTQKVQGYQRALTNFQNRFGKNALEAIEDEDELVNLFFQTETYDQTTLYCTSCFKEELPVQLSTIPPYTLGAAYINNEASGKRG